MKTFSIQGTVKHHERLHGLPDLLVVALDLDHTPLDDVRAGLRAGQLAANYERLGSVLTDASGSFRLDFGEQEFRLRDPDKRPDVVLLVVAPELAAGGMVPETGLGVPTHRVLHVSPALRLNAARTESYAIRIPDRVLVEAQVFATPHDPGEDPIRLESVLNQRRTALQGRLQLQRAHLGALDKVYGQLRDDARRALSGFSLSSVSDAARASDTYAGARDDLYAQQRRLFERGIERINPVSTQRFPVSIDAESARRLGVLSADGSVPGAVAARDFQEQLTGLTGAILERRRSLVERCVRDLVESDLEPLDPDVDRAPSTDEVESSPAGASVGMSDVARQLVGCGTCPEEPTIFRQVIDSEYRRRNLQNTVHGLKLVGGPADQTAFHEFHSIRVAFESVWSEAFDGLVEGLGHDLYVELVESANDTAVERQRRAAEALATLFTGKRFGPGELRDVLQRTSLVEDDINPRVRKLFSELDARLREPYKFDVFAEGSVNHAVVYTYLQRWEPGPYQVGRLVKTVPLAPKEEKRYKIRTTRKVTHAEKEAAERDFKRTTEEQSTARAESEIISRATRKASLNTTSKGELDFQLADMEFGVETGLEAERFSEQTKKNFREAVLKASEEYRRSVKTEVTTQVESTTDSQDEGVLINPNEEIAVTYLFYELQRQYTLSEHLHRATPVILVAFAVPRPHEIDRDWILSHEWILRRAILDESFLPALDYVTDSSVGAELRVDEFKAALTKQQKFVDELSRELELKNDYITGLSEWVRNAVFADTALDTFKDVSDAIVKLTNPLAMLGGGIFGGEDGPNFDEIRQYMELELDRSEKERRALLGRIQAAQDKLERLTEKYGDLTKDFLDKEARVAQLRIHIKTHILHYMQAIWRAEDPQQRFLRLYNIEVDWFEPEGEVRTDGLIPRRDPETGEIEAVEGELSLPTLSMSREKRRLVEVANIDVLLGFMGNYAIFPVKTPNTLHVHMMRQFVDYSTGGVRDADAFAELSTQQLLDYLRCLRRDDEALYARQRDHLLRVINDRRRSPRKENELIVVPTDSLYVEALPGKHPVLEDFKLAHRALDVKKVQAEVRQLELENVRYAQRITLGELGDPQVDEQVHNYSFVRPPEVAEP